MKFYIVTPTFNSLSWLQNCIRSVADQCSDALHVHHHVQDGGSTDGTAAWLEEWEQAQAGSLHYSFSYVSGKDGGMYDAINRAWDALPEDADVTAHLNSDEQYLPGALAELAAQFEQHPKAEVALGSYLILDAESRYICHRRPVHPSAWRSTTVCEIITCSCFYRADYFRKLHLRFDTQYRSLADLIFYIELTRSKPEFLVLPELMTSSFTVTGHNLAWSELSLREWQSHMASLPFYISKSHGINYRWVNLKRHWVNRRCTAPHEYHIYHNTGSERRRHAIQRPTSHWGCRVEGERD